MFPDMYLASMPHKFFTRPYLPFPPFYPHYTNYPLVLDDFRWFFRTYDIFSSF